MFGDTFRSLSLLRDSLLFRVGVEESDPTILHNEVTKTTIKKRCQPLIVFFFFFLNFKAEKNGVGKS